MTSGSKEFAAEPSAEDYIPRGAEQAKEQTDGREQGTTTNTVEVKNSNGSSSLVELRKVGGGYIDPRGTYFDHLPSGEDLSPIYGF